MARAAGLGCRMQRLLARWQGAARRLLRRDSACDDLRLQQGWAHTERLDWARMQDSMITGALEATARHSDLLRGELLLAGNRVQSLLESLLRWSRTRVGAFGHALLVCTDEGAPQLADIVGDLDRSTVLAVAEAFWRGETPVQNRSWVAINLNDDTGRFGILITYLPHGSDADGHALLLAAATLLAQRLPDALELERLRRAMAQLEEAERLQRALYRIADLASGERDMDSVLAEIHRIVADLMYAENFFIAFYDAEHQLLTLPYFRDSVDADVPNGQVFAASDWEGSLTLQVLRTGKALMGPSDELLRAHNLQPDGHGPRSEDWLGVPMLRGNDVIGVLVVQSYDQSRHYTDKEHALLNFVAQHVATALERLRAHEELERRVQERTEELRATNEALRAQIRERERAEKLQAALFRIAELGSTTATLDAFYQSLHTVIGELIYAENFYIGLLADDGARIDFPYSVDEHDRARPSRPIAHGLTEYVLRTGQPLLADKTTLAEMAQRGELQLYGTQSTSWLGVPLICDDRTVGVMAAQSYDDLHRYSARDQAILTFVSYHIANALQRKNQADFLREANATLEQRVLERTEALASINTALRDQIAERERAERRLRHAALHDALTGLPNRSLLLDRMAQALSNYRRDPSAGFAVLFLDLDRFKVVNDSVGHLVGDELLKVAGSRIRAQLPPDAMIARLGGDEFAVLLETGPASRAAPDVAARIIKALEGPLRIAGRDIYSSASIGIAFSQAHYRTAEELLRDADAALYRAKARGRRRYEIFDEDLRHQVLWQLELEGNLRRALVRREFEPVFQPIFDLHTGQVQGFEALMRWRHPLQGLLEPAMFLQQADESGLSEAMDWLVFESAFAQAETLLGGHAYLGINVGARHLRTPQFVDTLLRRLDAAGLSPAQLRIEITESVLLEDPTQSRILMDRLRDHGVSIALDDFGTGYSSLSYLHQFPLQAIKIDRSFISPLDTAAGGSSATVLRAIHALGAELGLEVIAEGIETEAQLEQVKALGQVHGQGFLMARPASLHALLASGLTGR